MATYTATLTRAYSVKNWNWPSSLAAGQGYWSDSTDPDFGFIAFDIAVMRGLWNSGQRISSCSLYFKRSSGNWGSPRTMHVYASKIDPSSLPAAKPSTAFTANRLTGNLYDISCPALTVNGQWITVTVPNALVQELITNNAGTGFQLEYSGNNDYMFTGDSPTTTLPVLTVNWYNPTSACGAPTLLSLGATLSEDSVTLSGSGASAGTGNAITGYEVQYRDSVDGVNWGAWAALTVVPSSTTSFSTSVMPPDTRGNYRQLRARTQGSAGASYYSGWKESTNTVRKNRLPGAPVIAFPVNGTTTYNACPRIAFQIGSEPDGQGQLAKLSVDETDAFSNGVNSAYFSRVGASFGNGDCLIACWGTVLSIGSHTITVVAQDGMSAVDGASMPRTITVAALNLADPVLIPGVTEVKAVHITELRVALTNLLAYFGLPAVSWPAITAGVTDISASHIQQLRDVVNSIINAINGFDPAGSLVIPLPAWTDPVLVSGEDGTVVKAAHINEIRAMILNL